MQMNRVLVFMATLSLSVASVNAEPQHKWTLRECIDYALANNITLKKAELTRRSKAEDTKQSKAALLPSLNAQTNQSVGHRPWNDIGVSTVTNGTVASSVKKSYYNGSYGVSASWTVWDGNANRNAVKQSKIAEQQAELTEAETSNSIQEEIAKLYVQILYLKEAITVTKQNYETSLKNEERGRELVEIGKMSKADLAQLTAQAAADKYSVVEAESNLASYTTQLMQVLELTEDSGFDIAFAAADDQQALSDIPDLQSVYETALTCRPEIKNSILAIEGSNASLAIAKAGKLPTLSLSGGVATSMTSMNSRSWGTQLKTNFDASVGATISIPIADNRKTKTAVNKAKLQQEEYKLELQEKKKQIYNTVDTYWLDATTNQAKFKAAQASVESEQTGYDLLSEQFRLGMKNIVELMTGKSNLMTAQQNKLQSKYTTILNIQLLRFYKGETLNI